VHPDDVEERRRIFELLFESPQISIQKEFRFKHKDGSWRVLETVSKMIDDSESGISGILVNSRDVTQRNRDEAKLRVYTAKLEQSNRELQDFAYVASHDLQEPLRKVQAFGDRLFRKYNDSLNEEGQDYIRRMRDAAGRMQTLIGDLLTFSRITTKAQPFQSVDLHKICEEVVSDLEVRIEQTGGKVEIGELLTIDADAVQMRQLFQNLIGNALKFHRAGVPPVVKIFAETVSVTGASFTFEGQEMQTSNDSEQVCHLIFEDNGIGFEDKYLEKIFTVFQRLHGRNEYEGAGIGLAVCRKIVERHNGTITASGEVNKGAKFLVTLPLKQLGEE
jgi:light-regulated signal transduction histidine kinase (bacteriophytochrome)